MKYRTIIEISTDAANKNEAMEIVGEYLSGNLSSGVDMRCRTKSVHKYTKPILGAATILVLLTVGILSIGQVASQKTVGGNLGISAVQPPLQTSIALNKAEFKKTWEEKQIREALIRIKK